MTEFTSEIKTIPYPQEDIYTFVSDLRNIELFKEQTNDDRLKNIICTEDSCEISAEPLGMIKFNVVERDPYSIIKFAAERVPFDVNMWIQLKQADSETKLKVTVKADLNPFIKPMVAKPLQEALNKIADIIASLPYDKLRNNANQQESGE